MSKKVALEEPIRVTDDPRSRDLDHGHNRQILHFSCYRNDVGTKVVVNESNVTPALFQGHVTWTKVTNS
jgi:hypothetical protein